MEDYNADDVSKELLYDLRQYYARIVGEILIQIATARKEKRFMDYYDWLDSLYTEINQKLDVDERKEYLNVLKETQDVINKYEQVYLGKLDKNDAKNEIYNALNELDMWLKDKMEAHGLYGRKFDDEGL